MSHILEEMSLSHLKGFITSLPGSYIDWWKHEYESSPAHVVIETALVLLILYIVFVKRSYDPAKRGMGSRAPAKLSEKQIESLIDEWEPEPLIPPGFSIDLQRTHESHPNSIVVRKHFPGSNKIYADGVEGEMLNVASADFLGFGSSTEIKETAREVLQEYTCGSCGPRGFYGTTEKHLELEDTLAKFMGTPESITYSDATSTIMSAIPAFAKRGDLLVVDDGVNHAVQNGCRLSRSKVVFFKHNDVEDLKRVLQQVRAGDRKRDLSLSQRRFIVVEGIYANHGDICPLPEILNLKHEYKFRVILDDSFGWGVLGAQGRGTVEHFGRQVDEVDVLLGSLSTTMASVGGFCVGNREVVDHQRLSGAGYCFSASSPPFLCATAARGIQLMQEKPAKLIQLRQNCVTVHDKFNKMFKDDDLLTLVSSKESPVQHLRLNGKIMEAIAQLAHAVAKLEASSPDNRQRCQRVAELNGSNALQLEDDPETGDLTQTGTHGMYAVSGFEETIQGSRNLNGALTTTSADAHIVLRSFGNIGLPDMSQVVKYIRYRETEEVLSAIVHIAAEKGVVISRSRYLATDSLAPEPTLKVFVTSTLSDNDIQQCVDTVRASIDQAAKEYFDLLDQRLECLRKGIQLNLEASNAGDRSMDALVVDSQKQHADGEMSLSAAMSLAVLMRQAGHTSHAPVNVIDEDAVKIDHPLLDGAPKNLFKKAKVLSVDSTPRKNDNTTRRRSSRLRKQ